MLELSRNYLAFTLVLLLLWEYFFPREVISDLKQRWLNNFGLYLFNLLIKWGFTLLITLFSISMITIKHEYTLIYLLENNLSPAYFLLLSLLIIDIFSYGIHRLFHTYKLLWCMHLVHHSDIQLDVTTNFRHHPFEQIATSLIFAIFMLFTQLPLKAMVIYAITSTIIQLWHHSNININTKIDRIMGWLIVTPRIHKVHHSAYIKETNSNYGTLFSCWDRLFSTFLSPYTTDKTTTFRVGLEYFRTNNEQTFWKILQQPLMMAKQSNKQNTDMQKETKNR
ncbi:MAG: hypothetical protein COB35_07150 [Gammaproteobacteria bacterium]|nr:MAG: hypothetical protein COB35_07150 [Gammaproteobacteria bacterium]